MGNAFRAVTPLMVLAMLCTACSDLAEPHDATQDPLRPELIINGRPTGSAFGNVGALLFDFTGDGAITGDEQLCSGSLIAPTVFLTAGHCLAFLPSDAQLYVTFDPDLLPVPSGLIAAVGFQAHPEFGANTANPRDVGVVLLAPGSTSGITPLELPAPGALDRLAAGGGLRGELFLNVGYGVSATARGRPSFDYDGVRKVSESPFRALTHYWLGLLMNSNATELGGDCYGDSGSPKFLDGNRQVIYAVTSWGDLPCRATSWDYRLDTDSAREFLGQFVSLPQ
jgi:hypothetical protein